MRRLGKALFATAALATLAVVPVARAEVTVVLDEAGRFTPVVTSAGGSGHAARYWEPTGIAAVGRWVLNPNGDLRGDGRPSVAVNPLTGFPTVAWTTKVGRGVDVVSSTFLGDGWSDPVAVHAVNAVDDLDPQIAFSAEGLAVVVWWQKGPRPVVRLAWAAPEGSWVDGGIVSGASEKARQPALLLKDGLTIVSYRTPYGVRIVTPTVGPTARPWFGDGPTPFPDQDGGTPSADGPQR